MSLKTLLKRKMNWPAPTPSKCGKWLELSSAPMNIAEKGTHEDSYVVNYPVSITYNGGTVYKDNWYKGYRVPPPVVPEGYELIGMGVGEQLNSHPPYATMYLKKIIE